jgi:quercetin dioxygenase-like cupin family protein
MAEKKPEIENVLYGREELEKRKKAPVLMKAEDVAARFTQQFRATLIVDPTIGFNNRVIRMWINKIAPGSEEGYGWKVLGHRHTVEAVIYIKQGRGYSVIDGKRYDWEAGDFICVPYFAWHRHVNTGIEEMHYIACTTQPFSRAMGVAVYEDERYPEYWVFAQKGEGAMTTLIPGGAEVPASVEPPSLEGNGGSRASSLYEEQLRFASDEELKRRQAKVFVKGKDLRMEKTRMGPLAYVVDPRIGFHVKTVSTLVAEIPPGGRSGAHRHLYEEIEYVLSGQGYSVIEDRKYEWKEGDALSIPMFGWHQHFNSGSKPARFLVHTSRVGMENLGHVLTQQGEACSP